MYCRLCGFVGISSYPLEDTTGRNYPNNGLFVSPDVLSSLWFRRDIIVPQRFPVIKQPISDSGPFLCFKLTEIHGLPVLESTCADSFASGLNLWVQRVTTALVYSGVSSRRQRRKAASFQDVGCEAHFTSPHNPVCNNVRTSFAVT
nr:MAG TPA: hypothetical protein [Caudoviricetes sp.]